MNDKTPLAGFVSTDVSAARIARIWQGVSERLSTRGPRRSPWIAPVAALGAGLLSLAIGWQLLGAPGWGLRTVRENATLSTSRDVQGVHLADGSKVELAAHTRVEVLESRESTVLLRLTEGRVDCDVVANRSRRFIVSAEDVEVRVTGTQFSVELSSGKDRVLVEVSEGSVEVRVPNGKAVPRRVGAGERWSIAVMRPARGEQDSKELPGGPPPNSPPEPAINRVVEPQPETPPTPSPSSSDRARERTRLVLETSGARELLDQANAARRAGNIAHAVSGYEHLLAKYPRDARAGLAAFELGRLRMDRLGNLPGAVSALRQAVLLAQDAGIREDAMARLVRAYDALGSPDRCREAQATYLKSFPSGVHAAAVSTRCRAKTVAPDKP